MMSLQFEPIDITEKRPTHEQYCNVFETREYHHWVYAYWCQDPTTGERHFSRWHNGTQERIEASHWMPEPGKPKPMTIGNTAEPIYCKYCETELEGVSNVRIGVAEIFLKALRILGYDDPVGMRVGWILEREATILELRDLCGEFGDNDWDENLSLADVVGKHLGRRLYSEIGSWDNE